MKAIVRIQKQLAFEAINLLSQNSANEIRKKNGEENTFVAYVDVKDRSQARTVYFNFTTNQIIITTPHTNCSVNLLNLAINHISDDKDLFIIGSILLRETASDSLAQNFIEVLDRNMFSIDLSSVEEIVDRDFCSQLTNDDIAELATTF